MALSDAAEQQLNEMANTLPGLTHHGLEEFRQPVKVFIAIYNTGDIESLHPDVIREWAAARGWSASDARDLGEMAEIVRATMSELGM